MTDDVTLFDKMTINSKYNFRTESSQQNNLSDDSCVKMWRRTVVNDGGGIPSYGWIQRIFRHVPFEGGPITHFFYVEWGRILREKTSTGLTQVKLEVNRDPQYNPVISVCDIVPYNIVLLPAEYESVWSIRVDTFVVVDYMVKLGSHLKK